MRITGKIALVAAFFGLFGYAVADEAGEEIGKAWQRYSTPGAEHASLGKLAGSFNVEIAANGNTTKGTAERKALLNGLFLQEDFQGTCPCTGGDFKGIGTFGYDNARKKHVTTWIDISGSGILVGEGTADAKGSVITYENKTTDPVSGKTKTQRSVFTIVSNDKQTYELFDVGPEGKEVRFVLVTYSRK